jgi:hypothetical protein
LALTTRLACHAAVAPSLLARARQKAGVTSSYLRGRQSYNGGFCFYRYEGVDEPSLHDTYHAIAGFKLLGEETPRADEAASFLSSFPAAGVHQLYYCAFGLDLLGRSSLLSQALLESVSGLRVAPPGDRDLASSAWLQAALRAARLQQRFAGAKRRT